MNRTDLPRDIRKNQELKDRYDGWMNDKSQTGKYFGHEMIFLYNGALLDSDGECALPIPRLFHSVEDAQKWADSQELPIFVVKGVRRGDILVRA